MKQFRKILSFELKNYLMNKVFVGVTLFLVLLIAITMFFPRISESFKAVETPEQGESSELLPADREGLPVLLLAGSGDMSEEDKAAVYTAFYAAFSDYDVQLSEDDAASIKEAIREEKAECAFLMQGITSYTYYVNNLSMYDDNTFLADEILQDVYRIRAMAEGGISVEDAQSILAAQIEHETEMLGKDQFKNYFYTYIMIFALYMVILLYGQMVATNVATEKSSRAMELLITSARPVSMMFGKVIASCLAGFAQLTVVFGSAFLCFNLNRSYFEEGGIVSSIFDMPLSLLLYMLTFFVLGFFIYAFLFGAVGSTVSKLEDINTAVMPITMLFIIAFFVVMFSLAANTMDTLLMRVCSYVPFTSPMAMFTRIAMSNVPWYEIVLSVVILAASVVGIGILAAKIYRVGVLLYGRKPKIGEILKAIKRA